MYAAILIGALLGCGRRFWLIRAGIALAAASAPAFALGCEDIHPDGSASCYLTGTYDLRDENRTWLEIINPTGHDLLIYAYFFDANERPMRCFYTPMSANDLWEIPVHELGIHADHGVAKVISFAKPGETRIGIVGNQRTWFVKQRNISETGLHPIQGKILEEDLRKMIEPSFKECKRFVQK